MPRRGATDRPRASAAPPWVGKSRHRSSERARQPYEDAACANRTPLWRPFRASMMIPYSQGGATRLAPRGLPWADMLRPLRGNRNGPNRNGCQTQIVLSSGWGCGTIAVDPEKGKTLCTYVTAASSNVRYKPAGRPEPRTGPVRPKRQTIPELYQVLAECADEAEQRRVYERLTAEGLKCRLLTL